MMTKALLVLLVILTNIKVYSKAETDICQLRIIYSVTSRILNEKSHNQIYNSDYELLIGNEWSKFQNAIYNQFIHYKDSVLAVSPIEGIMEIEQSQYADKVRTRYILYKNYPKPNILLYKDHLMGFYFFYEEPIPEINWTFCDGDTTIVGYACKKAVAEHRGRTWTAWYAIDLPYDNGPWKLQGLPGLILYAKESKGEFAFECKGIEKGKDAPIKTDNHKAEKVTGKQYNELLKEYWHDQSRFIKKHLNLGFKDEPSDTTIMKRFTPCLMEYY